ncbi:MAG: cytochrome-c peroxidase [Planctomycetia bacterium]|nr:cytochrome-c peroxidase [Planctomycetia bacterium]
MDAAWSQSQSAVRGSWAVVIRALAAAITLGVAGNGEAQQGATPKKPPRPERTAATRVIAANRLRDIYRGDPHSWPPPHVDPEIEWREIGLLPEVVHPESNPRSTEKEALGRTLFFDARLSASGKLACVSCHEPSLGWADGRGVSEPRGKGPGRNAQTIRNAVFQPALFWDGRAASLEEQIEEALTNPAEMAADRDQVVRLLAATPGYRKLYDDAFPGRALEFAAVVEAVACFERTVVGGKSRFDAFMKGDASALSDEEVLGLDLFRRDARCMNCHHGPMFSDGRFHDLGLSFHGRTNEDLGRYRITHDPADKGRFRTPTLRDVTQTSPFMHTGMFELRGVLAMYNAGMVTLKRQAFERDDGEFPVKSPHLKPLGLNRQDLDDLAAFLASLEEPPRGMRPPPLPGIEDQPVSAER